MFSSICSTARVTALELKFLLAAHQGDVAGVKECLEAGVNINTVNAAGLSALHHAAHFAAHEGHFEVVKLLLRHGININLKSVAKRTAKEEIYSYPPMPKSIKAIEIRERIADLINFANEIFKFLYTQFERWDRYRQSYEIPIPEMYLPYLNCYPEFQYLLLSHSPLLAITEDTVHYIESILVKQEILPLINIVFNFLQAQLARWQEAKARVFPYEEIRFTVPISWEYVKYLNFHPTESRQFVYFTDDGPSAEAFLLITDRTIPDIKAFLDKQHPECYRFVTGISPWSNLRQFIA
jgi:hypothetical protein